MHIDEFCSENTNKQFKYKQTVYSKFQYTNTKSTVTHPSDATVYYHSNINLCRPWILKYLLPIIIFAYKNIFVSGHNKMWSDMITTNCYVLQEKNEIRNPLAVHLLLCDFKNVLSFGHN